MKNRITFLFAVSLINEIISDVTFMCKFRTKSTYFTRSSKMGFKDIILFLTNLVRKSLQVELDEYFKLKKSNEIPISKQSFSEARQKVSPQAFVEMNNKILSWYYAEDDFKSFKGYRLSAIDGSIIQLNSSSTLKDSFGCEKNGRIEIARALVSEIYDIENNMILASTVTKCTMSERKVAIELIEQLKKSELKNDLILFDRGYPSYEMITYLEKTEIKYVMRAQLSFIKAVNEAKEPDQIVEIKGTDGKIIKVRVVRFMLSSGIEEILITNLLDADLDVDDFKKLYFKRWGIEIKYNEMKNRILLEDFTGDTKIAIEQDFYASVYIANMASIAKREADESIVKRNKGKTLKYEYKVNLNILIGKLKNNLVLMMLEDSKIKRTYMFKKIMIEISRNVVPIRPGRSNVRRIDKKTNKYPMNQKHSL